MIAALLCLLLLKSSTPAFIEKYYSRKLFVIIRAFFDHTFGKLPFPSIYLFAALLLLLFTQWILHFFREKPHPLKKRIRVMLSFLAFMVCLFFLLWGFNYGRQSLSSSLHLDLHPLSAEQLRTEAEQTAGRLLEIREKIQKDTMSLPEIIFVNKLEENCQKALGQTLTELHYPVSSVRGRLLPEDVFLVFDVGGMYLPFVGEANIDDAVYYSKKPFYMIHEMAHGNGFTEEADCNFLAYLSCLSSSNLSLRYSGDLNYLLYLLGEWRQQDSTACDAFLDAMPTLLHKDILELQQYERRHSFRTGVAGDVINNFYLKFLGIKEGTLNYNKMVLMIYAWKNR